MLRMEALSWTLPLTPSYLSQVGQLGQGWGVPSVSSVNLGRMRVSGHRGVRDPEGRGEKHDGHSPK